MILPEMAKTPGRIYIRELSDEIVRKPNTIRKWERSKVLPARLRPKRDENNQRYWTATQVRGIKSWMHKNDMRPGNTITDPSKEQEHISHLRRPKFLTGNNIRSAREMSANGKTLDQILRRVYPRTKYATVESLERALRQVANEQGWDLPRRSRPKPPKKRRKTAAK